MRINIKSSEKNKRYLLEQIGFQAAPKINKQVLSQIAKPIKELVIAELKNHPAYKGIIGEKSEDPQWDIQAHMGLDFTEVANFVEAFDKILEDNLLVQQSKKSILGLDIYFPDKQQILDQVGENGRYTSINGFEIEWLKWVLDGIGAVDAAIFLNHSDGRDFSLEGSKTGRAIMIKPNDNFDKTWSVSNYAFGKRNNFVEGTLNNIQFKNKVSSIVTKVYNEVIKGYK